MNFEDAWVGIGAKSGGMLGIGGVESTTGRFFNLANPNIQWNFSITSSRWGLGLGGGGGLVVICVFDLKGLYWLHGQRLNDWGVNVSLGNRWADAAKFFRAIKIVGPSLSKLVTHLDEIRNVMHYIYNDYELAMSDEQHPIITLDVPLAGVGLELSAFKTSGKIWLSD